MKPTAVTPTSVDAYIVGFPSEVRAALEAIRSAVKQVAPNATERISYMIPSFALNGALVHFAAYKKHIGFYPGASAIEHFRTELAGYKTAKGTVQFRLDRAVPLGLIRRIVEFRVRENEAKATGPAKARGSECRLS